MWVLNWRSQSISGSGLEPWGVGSVSVSESLGSRTLPSVVNNKVYYVWKLYGNIGCGVSSSAIQNLVDFWLEIKRLTKKIDVTWNAIMAKNLPNLVNPSLKIHIWYWYNQRIS